MSLRLKRLLWYCAAATTLALVFAAYLRPQFMVDLASRIMLCA